MNYFLFSCAATIMINISGEPWNREDEENMRAATARCPQLYSDAPCLSKFIKKQARTYEALCGGEI
jgi:hypothetical protein